MKRHQEPKAIRKQFESNRVVSGPDRKGLDSSEMLQIAREEVDFPGNWGLAGTLEKTFLLSPELLRSGTLHELWFSIQGWA